MSLLLRRGEPRERTGTPVDLLAIGLGNPGAEYERTRHNVGAETIGLLAGRLSVSLRRERGTNALAAEAGLGGRRVLLAVPETYMNDSGLAARALLRRAGLSSMDRLVVVHDDLDLPPGAVRVKRGGGTAGHNGLRSLQAHLHSLEFCRVRIGIGKPPGRMAGADFVLRRPGRDEREVLDIAEQRAADAVEVILAQGVVAAMNAFNAREDREDREDREGRNGAPGWDGDADERGSRR